MDGSDIDSSDIDSSDMDSDMDGSDSDRYIFLDDSDTDDHSVVDLEDGHAESVFDATQILLGRRTGPALELSVDIHNDFTMEEDLLEFDEMLAALQENLIITELTIDVADFDQTCASLERFFRVVLPTHPSLARVCFLQCRILAEYIAMLAASITNRGQRLSILRELEFIRTPINQQGMDALANNLLRANAEVEMLAFVNCGIDSAGCQAIFTALNLNSHLRTLNLRGNLISEISLLGVQALSKSSLRTLCLSDNHLTSEAVRALVKGLRLNFSLEELDLCGNTPLTTFEFFEELLTKFNFTLRVLGINSEFSNLPSRHQQRIDELLLLNKRVRIAHNSLESQHNYHLPEMSLWPCTLDCISSKPSLLYRFVRHGNLNAFAKQMLFDPNEGLRRSRRHKRPMQRYNPTG